MNIHGNVMNERTRSRAAVNINWMRRGEVSSLSIHFWYHLINMILSLFFMDWLPGWRIIHSCCLLFINRMKQCISSSPANVVSGVWITWVINNGRVSVSGKFLSPKWCSESEEFQRHHSFHPVRSSPYHPKFAHSSCICNAMSCLIC